MNIIPIVFAFDENLIIPAGVCITSLLENASEDTFYDIFIIHSSKVSFINTILMKIPELYSNCRINFRTISGQFESSYEVRGITSSTYYRLMIPEIIHEYDKVLYSDVDVIFRDDLSDFYNQDLSGYYLGGVDNCSFVRPDMQKYIHDELGLDYNKGYFYAGNILINSYLMRKDNIVDKFKMLSNNNYKQQDMDIINIVCNGKIKALSPAYCVTTYIYELILNRREALLNKYSDKDLAYALDRGIIHYNGPKPWNQWCYNFDIWWHYYRKSFFFLEKDAMTFYNMRMTDMDRLSLFQRIKSVIKYFVYGKLS